MPLTSASICVLLSLWTLPPTLMASIQQPAPEPLMQDIQTLSAYGDRSTGSAGNEAVGEWIQQGFEEIGHTQIGSHWFSVPVRHHVKSTLTSLENDVTIPIYPFNGNAVSPGTLSQNGLQGPLIYVKRGELSHFNGLDVEDAIVLMEIDSGKNWQHAANLGARGLIYIDRGQTTKFLLADKFEMSPIRFPRFWLPAQPLHDLFGSFETIRDGNIAANVKLESEIAWQAATTRNIYCMVEGNNPNLKNQLIIVEAFYDSTAVISGLSPGADEACGLATLMELARKLKQTPPQRSVLLVATNGHAQTLAGMREMIWSIRTRSKDQRDLAKSLQKVIKKTRKTLSLLKGDIPRNNQDPADMKMFQSAVKEHIKTVVDFLSRRLMQLRMQEKTDENQAAIKALARERLKLRQLGWRADFSSLDETERQLLQWLVPDTIKTQQAILADAVKQEKELKGARKFRSLVKSRDLAAVISLHLSSHGDGVGAFNQGWLHQLKPTINRTSAYSFIDNVMLQGAQQVEKKLGLSPLYKDSLRPSRLRPWQSYFIDRPPLGGEISALGGYMGLSLVTTHDARPYWGTPYDNFEKVNASFAVDQGKFVCGLIRYLSQVPRLHEDIMPRDGFSTVSGRAKFLRHGELFADQPAPGSLLLSYQGPGMYYNMVDAMGNFQIRGIADKKHTLHKVIIEGYRFAPGTGEIIWAIDKKKTGINAYRVKMQRRQMETDLVMFACKQTTFFNLLEPRTFQYLTKVNILDGRREATPLRYWYSRIDTRSSTITSTFLDPGTRLKMTLSDSVIKKKMILINADSQHPEGTGFLVDDWPFIHQTEYQVAKDMWTLLEPRIGNLEQRGIYNEKIRELQSEGTTALNNAQLALENRKYDRFSEDSAKSWALASRVYDHVEKTQKDVLFGVLFYIALFVPFAFCLERFLFSYTSIYKRIAAFSSILILLIAVIYNVHPAFQLAYSPMVVILAFFIMGLSLMVTLIIFFRFEDEMILLQRQSKHAKTAEISRWKAFVASFFLGVSNLRRRRLRTILTCTTLIILTFTIMSFTSVKSIRHHARLLLQKQAPYNGFLLKNFNWNDFPPEALESLRNAFATNGLVVPRIWLETDDRTKPARIPVISNGRTGEAQGMIGLSADEIRVTGIDKTLVGGRWLRNSDRHAVLLPERMAINLGIDIDHLQDTFVSLWGIPFEVVGIFAGKQFQDHLDLDGESLTPVTFPSEAAMSMTDVEMEALESGEDVEEFQSLYQHIAGDSTLVVPHRTLASAGGRLKGVAILPHETKDTEEIARRLVDRFGLMLFSGETDGVFLYNASDTLSYSGIPNIIIPLFISVFIVLNTMIGSVYERKSEIGIYTSVGLAPSHVSFLFVAEAMALAVLSVVLGYLLAQTTAGLFANSTLWSGITVNYSSLAGVAAMLLVILVVLVSVIYPSKVAAQIAIPDVNRSWTLPEAHDNTIEVTLPFLMKVEEHRSIGGFIYDYFQGHLDVSHGIFSSGDVRFAFTCPTPPGIIKSGLSCTGTQCHRDRCLQLSSKVWLAPFDFGIMQQVDIQFCSSCEEPDFLEIKICLTRQSGEANAWRRINKTFLHALRKQLLMWRSLDAEAQDDYVKLIASADQNIKKVNRG